MTGQTSINWATMTWNPLAGCTRVTTGCDHCYAYALHNRRHAAYLNHNGINPKDGSRMPVQYAKPFSEIQLFTKRLDDPLHVRTPQRFFVNSMSDLFHSDVPDAFIQQVFATMHKARWHTFQILTKRPGRLKRVAPQLEWTPNIGIGVSIENDVLTARANALRDIPAGFRFLSCEPLLGPLPSLDLTNINWVITGGESGPGARHCDPDWVRSIRDRCVAKGVAFHHKQWGGLRPESKGRELDGRTWEEFPEITPAVRI